EHVAVEAAALVLVVLARLAELATRLVEDDRDRRHARVRVVRRHARLLVASRDQDVTDLAVALQVDQAVAVHPEHRLERLRVHRRERVVVTGRLDDELGGAARRDHVEHPHAFAHQLPLDAEVGVALRYHAHGPARGVGRRPVLAVRRDLRPGELLNARTVRAVARLRGLALGAYQDPVAPRRVFPQLVHSDLRTSAAGGCISTYDTHGRVRAGHKISEEAAMSTHSVRVYSSPT